MSSTAQTILTIGAILLVGLVADEAGSRTGVPRVTLLILLGFAVGPDALDLLPSESQDWFPTVSTIALTMVGFLLGAQGRIENLRSHGRATVTIAFAQGLGTALVVTAGLLAFGVDATLALSLGGVAVATDAAATVSVVEEQQAEGPFSQTLLSTVALDDVIALSLFGLLATAATYIEGQGDQLALAGEAAWEVLGAVGLGLVLGFPAALLTGRLRSGRPTQEEAYGLVLVTAGLAIWMDVSFLLAAVVMGATIANVASHHEVPFDEIERIEWPALVVFFVLAGASLDLDQLGSVWVLGVGYVVLRVLGKVIGCIAGGRLAGFEPGTSRWLGAAMLPQASVAIGLTLLAADRFPDIADDLVPLVVATTVLFELVGPVFTSLALRRVGEDG